MAKVLVGMSGGVDSAVAALLLKKAGHEVIGATLRTWQADDGEESRCCEIDDAFRSCMQIGIPHHSFNCLADFREKVVDPFVKMYMDGKTPNPCVVCNRCVKWDKMIYLADVLGAEYIATGHYANIVRNENGQYTVKQADFAEKDQTYMLWQLTQDQLKRTLMPLGGLSKEEVRRIAKEAGIPVADKPDSQEICFVPDGHYTEFIDTYAPGAAPGPGSFVDENGTVLGTHKGITHYTVGQRRGLGLAMGHYVYVTRIDAEKNEVVIGEEASLYRDSIVCENVNFMSIPAPACGEEIRCRGKIRYHHPLVDAVMHLERDGRLHVRFDTPVRAAAPGQSAVFYDEDGCVLAGGIIS